MAKKTVEVFITGGPTEQLLNFCFTVYFIYIIALEFRPYLHSNKSMVQYPCFLFLA